MSVHINSSLRIKWGHWILSFIFFIYLFLFFQFVRRRAIQMFEQVQTSLTFQTFLFFAARFGSNLHPFLFFVLKGKKCRCREDKVTVSLTQPSQGRSGESLQPESCIPKIVTLTVFSFTSFFVFCFVFPCCKCRVPLLTEFFISVFD